MQEIFAAKAEMNRAWVEHCAPFDEKYYSPDWIERRERGFLLTSPPETIENVRQSDTSSAEVITTGYRFRTTQHRQRYHLVASGVTWQIRRIEMECGICHATGKNRAGTAPCTLCKGKGWMGGDDVK